MVFWLMMGPNQPNHRFHLGEKAMFQAVTGQKNIDKAQSILLQIYKIKSGHISCLKLLSDNLPRIGMSKIVRSKFSTP